MIDAILYTLLGMALMHGAGAWYDEACWFALMRRVRRSPSLFIEHAEWHVFADKPAADTLYKVSYLIRSTRGQNGEGQS